MNFEKDLYEAIEPSRIKQDVDENLVKESNSELLILEPGQETDI